MMKKWLLSGSLAFVFLFVVASTKNLQDVGGALSNPTPMPPQAVAIKMADGLEIKGDFYTLLLVKKPLPRCSCINMVEIVTTGKISLRFCYKRAITYSLLICVGRV